MGGEEPPELHQSVQTLGGEGGGREGGGREGERGGKEGGREGGRRGEGGGGGQMGKRRKNLGTRPGHFSSY